MCNGCKCIPLHTQGRQYALWGLLGVREGQHDLPYATWNQTVGSAKSRCSEWPRWRCHFLRRQKEQRPSQVQRLVRSSQPWLFHCGSGRADNGQNEGCPALRVQDILTQRGKVEATLMAMTKAGSDPHNCCPREKVPGSHRTLSQEVGSCHRKYQALTENSSHAKLGLKVKTTCRPQNELAALQRCGVGKHMTRKSLIEKYYFSITIFDHERYDYVEMYRSRKSEENRLGSVCKEKR